MTLKEIMNDNFNLENLKGVLSFQVDVEYEIDESHKSFKNIKKVFKNQIQSYVKTKLNFEKTENNQYHLKTKDIKMISDQPYQT